MATPIPTTPTDPADSDMRNRLVAHYSTLLSNFTTSPLTFRVLTSLSSPPQDPSPLPPKTLYILDSSFNPPTLAHLHIAHTALLKDPIPSPSPKRLLLLLATTNADKNPSPASFPQRLSMMQLLAEELLAQFPDKGETTTEEAARLTIDIGVTKQPYFVDKAASISSEASSSTYHPEDTTQVHLLGYDTLLRLLDVKYYPPTHTLSPLHPFLARHRLLVTYRADDKWGDRLGQDEYLREIGEGVLDDVGGKREWVGEGTVRTVEGSDAGGGGVSSTKVREAARRGDGEMLSRFVTSGVREWILREGLYLE